MIRVHLIDGDSKHAYDRSQCDDRIKDGDVLVAHDAVAVLVEAWPVAPIPPYGHFDRLKDVDAFKAGEGRKYADALLIAEMISYSFQEA